MTYMLHGPTPLTLKHNSMGCKTSLEAPSSTTRCCCVWQQCLKGVEECQCPSSSRQQNLSRKQSFIPDSSDSGQKAGWVTWLENGGGCKQEALLHNWDGIKKPQDITNLFSCWQKKWIAKSSVLNQCLHSELQRMVVPQQTIFNQAGWVHSLFGWTDLRRKSKTENSILIGRELASASWKYWFSK